jgi:H+/Cl- antiporter ClcA
MTLFLKLVSLGAAVGFACGCASFVFLRGLDALTSMRSAHEQWVFALPLAGMFLGLALRRWGTSIQRGTGLVLEAYHHQASSEGLQRIPLRVAPMVLAGTWLTHAFGGSAGREGTAVQMGASLAEAIARLFRVSPDLRRRLLIAGMAGGFGSVFGTPIAGAIFGLEIVVVGRLDRSALVPAVAASFVGDRVARMLGAEHTVYPAYIPISLTPIVFGKLCLMGAAMALLAVAFLESIHRIKGVLEAKIPHPGLRMSLGGVAVVGLWQLTGTSDYLGLGLPMLTRAFTDPALPQWAFLAKLVFTVLTLGSGFIGGEVTPLFFIGATAGNVLAQRLGLPLTLGAGVGMAAVFGAAANTPLALAIMAAELLGPAIFPHAFLVVAIAYVLTGQRSLYRSQRFVRTKLGRPIQPSARGSSIVP